jgi:hypothetical protein
MALDFEGTNGLLFLSTEDREGFDIIGRNGTGSKKIFNLRNRSIFVLT